MIRGCRGRVYAMLAKEMSGYVAEPGEDYLVFAIQLAGFAGSGFEAAGAAGCAVTFLASSRHRHRGMMKGLFTSVAGKFKFPLKSEEIPDMPPGLTLAGNEIEALLVSVMRRFELAADPKPTLKDLLTAAFKDARPNPNTRKLEYMDLAAVKECTDTNFLPDQYKSLSIDTLDRRMAELRLYV